MSDNRITLYRPPESPEEYLEHYGVKGMKWGVRKNKPSSDEIMSARLRQAGRVNAVQQSRDRYKAATSKGSTMSNAQKNKAIREHEALRLDMLTSPDRVTSLYMTNGEKAASAIIAVGIPGGGTAGVGIGLGVRKALRSATEKERQRLLNDPEVQKILKPKK